VPEAVPVVVLGDGAGSNCRLRGGKLVILKGG
jgi:hypothetical protein